MLPNPRMAPLRRIVREYGLGFDIHVGHAIDAAGMARRAQQAFSARARVASCIAHDPHLYGEQMAFRVRADFVFQYHRMALDVMLRRLLARENCFYRALQEKRRQRGLPLDREFFFCAESAAAGGQLDFHFFDRAVSRTAATWFWSYVEPWLCE